MSIGLEMWPLKRTRGVGVLVHVAEIHGIGQCATDMACLKMPTLSSLCSGEHKDNRLTHSHAMTPFDAPGKQAF